MRESKILESIVFTYGVKKTVEAEQLRDNRLRGKGELGADEYLVLDKGHV